MGETAARWSHPDRDRRGGRHACAIKKNNGAWQNAETKPRDQGGRRRLLPQPKKAAIPDSTRRNDACSPNAPRRRRPPKTTAVVQQRHWWQKTTRAFATLGCARAPTYGAARQFRRPPAAQVIRRGWLLHICQTPPRSCALYVRFFEEGIVGISLAVGRIPSFEVIGRQFRATAQPLHKVGVADIGTAKADGVGKA